MPLHDHFRPPLSLRRHWHSFHNAWATYLSAQINEKLPPGWFAEANVQFGIEIDVATFEESPGIAMGWTPPAPTLSVPFTTATDVVEIKVFRDEGGPVLAGAIELVSPSNKDRPASRDAFVSKCAAYLQQGVGLVVVDVVTGMHANLHNDLLARLSSGAVEHMAELCASAYHPVERAGETSLDIWHEPLSVGNTLPTVPLWLRGGLCLPVDLESSYERTCQEQKVLANGTGVG